MMTVEPIAPGEVTTRQGRVGIFYQLNDDSGAGYVWNPVTSTMQPVTNRYTHRAVTTITGAATLTAAQLATGYIGYTGSAQNVTLCTAALLAAVIDAGQGTIFDFIVDNTGGSGTCTIVVGTGIVAGPAVITGGATLTVANSATQGIGLFRIVFSSASAAVLFRLG